MTSEPTNLPCRQRREPSAARPPSRRLMTVGELSARTGVSVKALREYADTGLVYTAGRSPANYRLFDEDALWCVRLIGYLRGLGLTVAEIRDLAAVYSDHADQPVGPHLAQRLMAARSRLSARIAELEQMRDRIDNFRSTHRSELAGDGCIVWLDGDPRRRRRVSA